MNKNSNIDLGDDIIEQHSTEQTMPIHVVVEPRLGVNMSKYLGSATRYDVHFNSSLTGIIPQEKQTIFKKV